jgi:hypothetical protein
MSKMGHGSSIRLDSSMSHNLNWREIEQFSFGDSPAMADKLADLVLAGLSGPHVGWSAMDR